MTGRSIRALRRIGALAVGAGIVASLASAGPSYATNCQPDGRISGGGATFQANAQRVVFEPSFRRNVCKAIPAGIADSNNEPNSTVRMVWYNASNSGTTGVARPSGSGAGINGAYCRVDAFSGSDVPYTNAQLALLRGAVPAQTDPLCTPFGSQPFEPTPAPYPTTGDTQSNIMSFPVAGGAVAIGFNLTAAACGGSTPPANIQLDSLQASRLLGGDIKSWNDAALVAIQPAGSTLANCNTPVSRFARSDNSGTTTIFKNYLNHADGARALCDGTTWSGRTGQNGNNFPSNPDPAVCSPVTYASGNPAVVNAVAAQVGGVGYGDLSDWIINGDGTTRTPALGIANVRNADNSAYVSPRSGSGSNCSFAGTALPAGGASGAVGLAGNAWSSEAVPNRADVTFLGNGYPICGFTWMLVRPGLTGGGTSISSLNQDQRDTLASYVYYILQPTTQAELSNNFYAPVPATMLPTIRQGYVANN